MKENNELFGKVKKYISELEMNWTSLKAHQLKKDLQRTFNYIKEHNQNQEGIDILQVIYEYNNEREQSQETIPIQQGYVYMMDAIEEFIKNPQMMWEVYDQTEDKKIFTYEEYCKYTLDKEQNKHEISRHLLYLLISSTMMSLVIDKLTPEMRKKTTSIILNSVKKNIKPGAEREEKEKLILSIQAIMKRLEHLDILEETKNIHNEKMKEAGIDILTIQDEKPIGENGEIYGKDLTKCSVLQLQAMFSFYANRLEKVEEELGRGIFMAYVFTNSSKLRENEIFKLDNELIKEAWKKHKLIYSVLEEEIETLKRDAEKIIDPTTDGMSIRGEEVYEKLYKKYEEIYNQQFEGSNLKEDFTIFYAVNGFSKFNNYLSKNGILEEVIVRSSREKINWGIIEDKENPKATLKDKVLIGIDIPGLNMPLRLHYPISELREVVYKYLETDEVPLYIGNEDFEEAGRNIGTQLLLPITTNEKEWIKRESKKSTNPKLLHIACTHLPNPLQKILNLKTGKTQITPDYINLKTGKIRRTERRKINLDEDNR